MSTLKSKGSIDNYKFHHIDTSKCLVCEKLSCEKACFRGIYKVINKKSEPKSVVVEEREDFCVKCHMCTTACKLGAISID